MLSQLLFVRLKAAGDALKQGRLDEANRFYARGLELNPAHPVALTNLGSNLVFMGKCRT